MGPSGISQVGLEGCECMRWIGDWGMVWGSLGQAFAAKQGHVLHGLQHACYARCLPSPAPPPPTRPPACLQAITAELLGAWGAAGLEQHLAGMQAEYARRAAALHAAALRELEGLAEWREPSGGMFMVRRRGLQSVWSTGVWCSCPTRVPLKSTEALR